jgi:hypothetical protein
MNTNHFSRLVLSLGALAAGFAAPLSASADEPAPAEAVVQPSDKRTGRSVGFGVENGLSGRAFEQGVKLRIPILEHFGVQLRGVSAFGDAGGDTAYYLGGRIDLVGQTPVYLNLVRLYGGGGPEVLTRVAGPGGDKTLIGGGGQFGFEFFVSPKMAFYVEIGGHSGNELTGGGTAIAGMTLYPFSGP